MEMRVESSLRSRDGMRVTGPYTGATDVHIVAKAGTDSKYAARPHACAAPGELDVAKWRFTNPRICGIMMVT